MGGSLKGNSESKSEVPAFVTKGGGFGVDRGMQLAEMGYMPYFGPDVAALSPMEYSGMQNTSNAASAFGMAAPGGGMGGGYGGGAPGGGQGGGMQGGMGGGQGQMPAQVGDSPEARAIAEAYQQNLGRAPEQAGYDAWKGQLDGGMSYNEIANRFANSPESRRVDPMTGLPVAGNFSGVNAYSGAPIFTGAQEQLQQRHPGQYEAYTGMFIDPQAGQMAGQEQSQSPNQGLLDQVTGSGQHASAQRRAIDKYGDASMAHMFMR